MEVSPVLGGGEVHFDVVQGFALAEIVVIGGSEEPRTVSSDDSLQITAVDVEGHRFESVHFVAKDLKRIGEDEEEIGMAPSREP